MQIQCFASIPVEKDEPAAAIRQFVAFLRAKAEDTGKAEIAINLIGVSSRARGTISGLRPEQSKGMKFDKALEFAEGLCSLGAAKSKSLSFILSATGFQWKGAAGGTEGRLVLADAKSFRKKERFSLSAQLAFEAADPHAPFIASTLDEVYRQTGVRFQLRDSLMGMAAGEPGRATAEEVFVASLAWAELVERIEHKVRHNIPLEGIPHLMTVPQALKFVFDPEKMGKSVRVDFGRVVRGWLKTEFPEYRSARGVMDTPIFQKEIAPNVLSALSIQKSDRPFSKRFSFQLAAGLTSPRFAPAVERPLWLSLNLFRFFGIGPLPLEWTYYTEPDLQEALAGAAVLIQKVLAIFEPLAAEMQRVHERRLGEFPGPREVSAKEAYDLALPLARDWSEDARLIRINTNATMALFASPISTHLPMMNDGRLAMNGGWWLTFHSAGKQGNLYVTVPCYGPVSQTRVHAPSGQHFPSDVDQVLRDGWLDSTDAARLAREALAKRDFPYETAEIQQFELSSRAKLADLAGGLRFTELRDGMFPMEAAWRIFFSRSGAEERQTAAVTVPVDGTGEPAVDVQRYDKLGRPPALQPAR